MSTFQTDALVLLGFVAVIVVLGLLDRAKDMKQFFKGSK